jgi:pilus assembly protein Flp/PilA
MTQVFVRLLRDDSGQDLIEYALLAGFISLVAVATITLVGQNVNTVYTKVDTKLKAIP